MRNYYRLMLKGTPTAAECFAGDFVGADYDIAVDLAGKLPEQWTEFNREFVPIFLRVHPSKSKISAGLACGALWTIAKAMQVGDVLLCPDGPERYRAAVITGEYFYAAQQTLPHRRQVRWLSSSIPREAMSELLQKACGALGVVISLTSYAQEIDWLIEKMQKPTERLPAPSPEDSLAFALEKYLEDYLVRNWEKTELARNYAIYAENGQPVGQQFQTSTGPIDILAVSHDRQKLLVITMKRGRASDVAVGQTLRLIGYVQEQIAEPGQSVEGVIITRDDDSKLRWAVAAVPFLTLFRYEVNFRLEHVPHDEKPRAQTSAAEYAETAN